MKRNAFIKFVILLLSVSMLLSLFACAPDDPEDPTDDTTQQETEPVANETDRQTEEPTKSSTEGETASEPETSPSITETEAAVSTETETPTDEKTDDESESDGESVSEAETIDESNTDEKETEEMQTEAIRDDLASVGVYDKYDLDSYMSPIWSGKVIHNETVMFVGIDDKASLLYDADRILSVRSYDLSIEYVQGVDYDYVDGKLVLLEGTRIPYVPLETYYSVLDPELPFLSTMYNGKVTQTMWGDGTAMTKWQVAVTYKHSDTWEGKTVDSYSDRYADFIGKLEKGEDVTVFFYGDSITTGATSSQSRAPYAPSFARMFVQYVAKQYGYTVKYVDSYTNDKLTSGQTAGGAPHPDTVFGTNGTITYINTAVGGWNTQQGRDNFDAYVKAYVEKYGCDLFILAFGMNNGGSTADQVCGYLDEIVVKMEACAPEADVLLVSTMLPNPEAVRNSADKYFCNGNQYTFEEAMYPLAEKIQERGIGCAVAPMTSVSKYIHQQKRYRDTTGNNVNHPSDFLARAYAQVIYQTVFGYENYGEDEVELENKPVENANFNAQMSVSGNTVYLDGASGTNNKNYAVCVRFEETQGGYYMYYVKDHGIVYINVENGSIVYSDTATSVWTYDESLGAMVSGECAVTLSAPEICFHPVIAGEGTHGRETCVRCGVEATNEAHAMVDTKTVNSDGSVTYSSSCEICGKVGKSNTIPAGVIYYSGADTYKSPDFYLLNKEIGENNGISFTRVTAKTSNHGHELHWINQNVEPYNDYSGNQLDTKGLRYLVIRLRASHTEISMKFQYKLLASNEGRYAVPVVKAGEWITYVLDLKALGGSNYAALEDGTYTMQYFKMYFGAGFDQIENGYVDFEYLALCDSFEQIAMIANSETVQMMTTSGSTTEVRSDGT